MKEYIVLLTIEEVVKVYSCCISAIADIEEKSRVKNLPYIINRIDPTENIDKILSVKSKLKKAMIASLGNNNGMITVILDISDIIKLNACCNAAIDMEQRTIELIDRSCTTVDNCIENINSIYKIKEKLKSVMREECENEA
jgi:hypothetical protein